MIVRALTQPLIRPLVQAITAIRPAFPANDPILSLFSAGEQGAYYDIQDLSSMYQDAAGTTACAVDAVVGYVADKSGNGNHATQTTTASKPYLRQNASGNYYLEFDGFDDFLVTAAINFTATDKMTVFAGVRKVSDASPGVLVELSASAGANAGTFMIDAPDSATDHYGFFAHGASTLALRLLTGFPAPITNILRFEIDFAAESARPYVNGVAQTPIAPGGGGNFGNYAMYIGRRGGTAFPLNGHLYALAIRGATTDAADITAVETEINTYTEAY